ADVVRVVRGLRIPDLVEGGREAAFADDERRAIRPLVAQELGRGAGGGPDVAIGHVQPDTLEPGREVARRVTGVVGQDQEGLTGLAQAGDESVSSRDQMVFTDD